MKSILNKLKKCFQKIYIKVVDNFQKIYCFVSLKKRKNIIVFLTPGDILINGGVLSIYSLASKTRDITGEKYFVQLCTYPNHVTYLMNRSFENKEIIVSFNRLLDVLEVGNVEKIIIHLPEYYSRFFFGALTSSQRRKLASFQDLRVNILNQNIEQLPEIQYLKDLEKITNKITITCSHSKFCNQNLSDKYKIPVHFFSVQLKSKYWKVIPFDKKKKQIVLSPDDSPLKKAVIELLRMNFPGWKLVTIRDCKYEEYLRLISESYFTISFGEGFDSYFIQPFFNNSIGISVYNEKFFPDKTWLQVETVFRSNDELLTSLIPIISSLLTNKGQYIQLQCNVKNKLSHLYSSKGFENNIELFYDEKYNYIPRKNLI